jgi:uncharacterized membrane protein YjjP (DUF1212 family)
LGDNFFAQTFIFVSNFLKHCLQIIRKNKKKNLDLDFFETFALFVWVDFNIKIFLGFLFTELKNMINAKTYKQG